ncbi:MAG TPA: TRAM domain-containing protein [Bauldia sp.]|nr:TRAM domain-containing protein [Bauldia sp.]
MAETVTIAALGHGGDGIADTAAGRVFVPYTLPGETVEIEAGEGERAALLRVVTPSADRVAAVCPNFGKCGICALEHMARPAYLAWKREQVVAAFAQRGVEADVAAMVPIAAGSRRRAIFSAVRTPKGVVLGFHARTSKTIVDIDACSVLVPGIVAKLPLLKKIVTVALSRWKPARVTVFLADNGLDIAIADAGKPDQTMLGKLGDFGRDPDIARLTVDGVEVFRNRAPEFAAGPATLFPVPGGFTQAAKAAEEALAEIVVNDVGSASPVADLFAGIGTFTFRLAAHAPVTAVEGDAALVAAIDFAAKRAKGVRKVASVRRDLFANPLAPAELDKFGAVVFDPPAAGAKAQAEMLAKSKVATVVAVSCNPATLARDARILIDGGYRLNRVVPVDQFLFSAEIEAVATFTR